MHKRLTITDGGPVRRSTALGGARTEALAALDDIRRGLALWRVWTSLAILDVRRRYRRTLIGPYWTSLSYAILVGSMAVVFSNLWNMKLADYLPYLSSGFIAWMFIMSIASEGCSVFVSSEGMLKNSTLPYSSYVFSMLLKNIIVMLHHMSVYAVIALVYLDVFNWNYLLVFPALFLILLNGAWLGLGLGIVVARYRDVQQIVTSALQIVLFITPIFWPVDKVSDAAPLFSRGAEYRLPRRFDLAAAASGPSTYVSRLGHHDRDNDRGLGRGLHDVRQAPSLSALLDLTP